MDGSEALPHAARNGYASPTKGEGVPQAGGLAVELRGTVRYLEYHTPPPEFGREAEDRLSFHLEGLGIAGKPARRTRVEVRSNRVGDLVIRDGDTVVVRGELVRPGELRARSVRNITTRSELRLDVRRPWANRLRTPLAALALIGVPAFMLGVIALACEQAGTGAALVVPSVGIWLAYWRLQRSTR